MSRVARAFLVWVMVVAMPVQGMAGSAMRFCAHSHELMMQGLMLEASAPGRDGVVTQATAAMDHGAHDRFSCNVCATCCAAWALPARFELPEDLRTVNTCRSSPVAPVSSHLPDRLDRPPRAILA